jgi:hypothetical protein
MAASDLPHKITGATVHHETKDTTIRKPASPAAEFEVQRKS